MEGASLTQQEVTARLRNKLNQEKVKLWVDPYTTETGERGEKCQEVAERYSVELELELELVANTIEELRVHALEKLAAKKKFQEQGIAVLKIKMAKNVTGASGTVPQQLEVLLSLSGLELKQRISTDTQIPADRLKLISGGRVIEDSGQLSQQQIKHGSQVLVICLTETEAEARQQQQQQERHNRTRQGAELLSNKDEVDDNSNYFLQIADQNGKPLDLPNVERKALVFAMTLHEKGRSALKKKQHGEALLLLLDAEKEFKKCRSDILQLVDNYALVCLDIVWCYLCVRDVSDLPDAQSKLQTCDDCFRKSYGPNLERLALVKGGTGTEKALFLRLHLLQGIVAFHQQRRAEATQLFNRAETELKSLQVDDSLISQVMELGYTSQEARLGLRLTEGNVQMAVSHIENRRQEKKEIKEKEKEKKRQRKIAKKLGKTGKGNDVHVPHYQSLVAMGFPKGASAEALRQADNDITAAIEVLQSHPELLSLPDPEPEAFTVTDDMVAQVMALGFEAESARAALHHCRSVERAVDELMQRAGDVPQDWVDSFMAGGSESDTTGSGSSTSTPAKSPEELEREKELIESVIEDLPRDEEDHLDLALEEEAQFLHEYKAYLDTKPAASSSS